ncbi:MAG: beta-galactosidase [Opitutaceae bacterium]|jgi:hypothetical protein|nr:beta-galactosidase [Opitutaceae bacterium]
MIRIVRSLLVSCVAVSVATAAAAATTVAAAAAVTLPAETWPGVPQGAHVYPFYPAAYREQAPVVRIRDREALYLDRGDPGEVVPLRDQDFGADFSGLWTAEGLEWVVDVRDPTPGETLLFEEMWRGDCVQLLLGLPQAGNGAGGGKRFRLGFARERDGRVEKFAFEGNPDWSRIEVSSGLIPSGYRLRVRLPWAGLGLPTGDAPEVFGINVVVGDRSVRDGVATRREAVWGPGGVSPSSHLEMVLAARRCGGEQAIFLRPGSLLLEQGQPLSGDLVVYSPSAAPAAEWEIALRAADHDRGEPPGRIAVGPFKPGHTARFALPAFPPGLAQAGEGLHVLVVGGGGGGGGGGGNGNGGGNGLRVESPRIRIQRAETRHRAIARQLEEVKQNLGALRQRLAGKPEFADDSYVKLGLATLDLFVGRLEDPSTWTYEPQPVEWAGYQVSELPGIIEDVERRLREGRPVTVPRPARGRPVIRDGLLWAREAGPDGNGAGEPRIFYYYGFGHFDRVDSDIPLLRDFGITLIQQERGPGSINEDGSIQERGNNAFSRNPRPTREIVKTAGEHGINVDLLLSPHYMPRWALRKHPALGLQAADRFRSLPFNIDHPIGRQLIERWLRTVLPTIKDSPALMSVCLSNEPIYKYSGRDEHSRPAWHAWLRRTHRTIDTLNTLYGTTYRDFPDVPVPVPPPLIPEDPLARRACYDRVRFNQHNLAAWHRWMNDIAKQEAPGVYTHVKLMADIMRGNQYLERGVDPELYSGFTDLAGNDCWTTSTPDNEYSYRWQHQEMWYTLLHSFKGQPVFNSENHLNLGHLPPPARIIPPGETWTALWQGALHHQAATTLWVWDQLHPPRHDMISSLLTRPANLHAACRAMLDLNRLAPQVAAISKQPARIAFLYSIPTLYWQPDHLPAREAAWAALTFLGQPATFISERQLATGERTPAHRNLSWILLARNTHISEAALRGLEDFVQKGGKILCLGPEAGNYDEYGRQRQPPAALRNAPRSSWTRGEATPTHLYPRLARWLEREGLHPRVRVLEVATGRPAWGVQHRFVEHEGRKLLSVTNLLARDRSVAVRIEGAGAEAVDLISGAKVDPRALALAPVKPLLLQFSP